MGQVDTTGWRLRLIIFITIVLFSIYSINAFFITQTDLHIGINQYDYLNNTNAQDFDVGFLGVLLGTLFFGYIAIGWLAALLSLFTFMCWFVIGYLTYTFIKEWVPW